MPERMSDVDAGTATAAFRFGQGLVKAAGELGLHPILATPIIGTGVLLAAVQHPEWAAAWAGRLNHQDFKDYPKYIVAMLPISFVQAPPDA